MDKNWYTNESVWNPSFSYPKLQEDLKKKKKKVRASLFCTRHVVVRRPQGHVYFAPVCPAQITIKTHPQALVLPLSMYQNDRTAQRGALSPQTLISCTGDGVYGVYRCVLVFVLFSFDCSLSVLFMFSLLANYTRTADQNVTSPARTQHSTGRSALHK